MYVCFQFENKADSVFDGTQYTCTMYILYRKNSTLGNFYSQNLAIEVRVLLSRGTVERLYLKKLNFKQYSQYCR